MTTDEQSWTWGEIALLRGAERTKFIEEYGDRGKLALLGADTTGRPCKGWGCWECPVGDIVSCQNEVQISRKYAELIARDGRMPEVPE